MYTIIFIFIILFICLISSIIYSLLYSQNNLTISKNQTNLNQYVLKEPFMTNFELYFYHTLKELESELNIVVHPQLSLNSVVNKKSKGFRNELFKIIDFAIFDQNYHRLLMLIEINDKTHKYQNRKKRDATVEEICRQANIKLIKFHSNYSNEKVYIKDRIRKILTSD